MVKLTRSAAQLDEVRREIVDSKRALKDLRGQSVTTFSYPWVAGTQHSFSRSIGGKKAGVRTG